MNGNIRTPLIERIIILGVAYEDLKAFFSAKTADLKELNALQIKILEEYKSNELKETPKENYIENIPTLCFPDGITVRMALDDTTISFVSFTLLADSKRRKQCTCLTFYENYNEGEYFFSLPKTIVLVSSMELFLTHKEILMNIYQIISKERLNKKSNSSNNDQIRYVYLKEKLQYCVYQESRILEFYFSFLLNSLSFTPEDRMGSSYYINNIGNNTGRKCFLRYHLDDLSSFPLKDYDLTLLLDRFNVEDLIQIYLGLLMEYKLIIIFDDYENINTILFSLISLIFPLKWKLLPIISFLTDNLLETLEAPFPIIIGAHSKYLTTITQKINDQVMTDETLAYNLSSKKFIFISDKFPQLPTKLSAELKSGIYLILSEKLAINSDVANSETELRKMFPEEICQKIEPMIYLNYKFISIFFGIFLEIIKNLESCIYFNKIKSMKSAKKDRVQLNEQFDFEKFSKDRDYYTEPKYVAFIKHFTTTMMLPEFLSKYIKHHCNEKKPKYKLIKKLITILHTKDNGKNIVKDLMREHIMKKIVSYYKFRYISLEEGFRSYIAKLGNLSQSSKYIAKDIALWTPLETYKIVNFSVNYNQFLLNEQDHIVKENPFCQLQKKLAEILLEKKAIRQYEEKSELSIPSHRPSMLDPKLKEFMEEAYWTNVNSISHIAKMTNMSTNTQHSRHPKAIHHHTPSLGSIINCDNNIENYFFNNINISADNLSKAIPLHMSNLKKSNHITPSPAQNTINTINSISSINSIKSTSMNPSVLTGSSHEVNENTPSSRNANSDFIKESLSNGIRLNTYQNMNISGNVNTNNSSVYLEENAKKEYKTNNNLYQLDMVKPSKFKPQDRKKIVTRSNNVDSLLKRGKKMIKEHSECSLHHPMNITISEVGVIPKLAGDEECDIFSDSDK